MKNGYDVHTIALGRQFLLLLCFFFIILSCVSDYITRGDKFYQEKNLTNPCNFVMLNEQQRMASHTHS